MLGGKPAVFISCSEKYKDEVAHRFRERIQAAGLKAVIVSEEPKLVGSWTPEEKVEGYLRACDAVVVLATPDDERASGEWTVRGNVLDEIARARTMDHLRGRIAVFKAPRVSLPSNIDPVYVTLEVTALSDALNALGAQLRSWDLERAVDAQKAAPRAEVEMRAIGNTASEHWVRWFHVEARTNGGVIAHGARVAVMERGVSKVFDNWLWQGGYVEQDLRSSGARIPLLIGGFAESIHAMTVGWWITKGNWYLTPEAHGPRGRFVATFTPAARHVFDVRVSWSEGGLELTADSSFELRFWNRPDSEPRFMKVGDRPSYHDQMGGLAEQHARGVALRNSGKALAAGDRDGWFAEVHSWTEETLAIINEAAPDQAVFFRTLNVFVPEDLDGVRILDNDHAVQLRATHERLNRLQRFIRAGEI